MLIYNCFIIYMIIGLLVLLKMCMRDGMKDYDAPVDELYIVALGIFLFMIFWLPAIILQWIEGRNMFYRKEIGGR